LAFAIRESGGAPAVAEGHFEHRAAPGYVPPRQAPKNRPISLDNANDSGEAPDGSDNPNKATPAVTEPIEDALPTLDIAMDETELGDSQHDLESNLGLPDPQDTTPIPSFESPAPPPQGRRQIPVIHSREDSEEVIPGYDANLEYRGAGRWTDLPLPEQGTDGGHLAGQDIYEDSLVDDYSYRTDPLKWIFDILRSDVFFFILGIGALVCLVLVVALLLIQ